EGLIRRIRRYHTLYREEGVDMSVREFPIIYSLVRKGPLSLADIQGLTGLSHSAVSQTVKKMAIKNILFLKTAEDARSKIVDFTDQGKSLVGKLKPIWHTCYRAMRSVLDECDTNILDAFSDYEGALSRKSFRERYKENKKTAQKPEVEIVPYDVKYRDDWHNINLQWIEKLFEIEETDLKYLKDPEKYILNKGGEIYFGLIDGKPVGAIALKHYKDTRFELSKMGVLPEAQGYGVAKMMIRKVIERYRARGGSELFLETNSSLIPAITLYKKMGFKEVPPNEDSPYSRADYFMELAEE
ncbi:MAG TPA: helix-turn-helix domain-containing GNAT family N-acetyltransferase, partial [Emcibacteraceae bacterium]|nr:helix-turn-helix domain-containing GNAT family N-acetyltransferase [Emcibacteraceae bacterium]